MIKDLKKDTEERMKKTIEALQTDLMGIRTGRATPALLDRVRVEYYGTPTPMNQVASVSAPEPRLLVVRPWDPGALGDIERALLKSDLGLTPNNDGKVIRLVIPRLTEERRQELAKMVARRVEEARVAVRNIRRDAMDDLREFEKEKMISEDEMYGGRDDIQKLTDSYIEKVDKIGQAKETELLEI